MAVQNINIRIHKDKKCILASYQGKSKLGNYLLYYTILTRKNSDKQFNINSLISRLIVKFQCERFVGTSIIKCQSFYQNGPHSIITLTINKTRQ